MGLVRCEGWSRDLRREGWSRDLGHEGQSRDIGPGTSSIVKVGPGAWSDVKVGPETRAVKVDPETLDRDSLFCTCTAYGLHSKICLFIVTTKMLVQPNSHSYLVAT